MDKKNDRHASPSSDDARVFEIGDTPTISRQNSASNEIDHEKDGIIVAASHVSANNKRTPGSNSDTLTGPAHSQSRSAIQPPVGFDPARIPASVFAAKSSTPMEWSFASNESLFSIHVGNTSFSKDQFLNMFRSGELTKFDHELARFSGVVSSDQINYASEITDGIRTPSDVSKDRFDWSYNATAQSFQFPVLVLSIYFIYN